ELVGVLVIKSERNADEHRGDEEDREVPLAQQYERVEAEEPPEPHRLIAPRLRRCARQGEAVETEGEGGERAHEEGIAQRALTDAGARIPAEQVADHNSRDDPADRAPEPHPGEVPGGLVHLAEG